MSESTHTSPPHGTGGYEKSDADTRSLARFGLGLAAIALVVLAAMFGLLKLLDQRQKSSQPARHPLSEASQLPPLPRLQISPEVDLKKFRAREDSLLHSYGWIMKDAGAVRIPIDRAMKLVAERGLPSRMEAGGGRPQAGGAK